MDLTFALLGLVVLTAFTIEATAGFGSIIISVAVASHLYSISELLPVLVPLNFIIAIYMVTRHRGHVAGKLIAYRVLPFMCAGVAVGVAITYVLEGQELKFGFGVLIIVLALTELYKLYMSVEVAHRPWTWVNAVYVKAAGVIHGIYATGGPLLVYSLSRTELPKTTLRSTLATIWLIFDIILTTTFIVQGRINETTLSRIAILAPVVVLSIVLGEWLHHRISEKPFKKMIYLLLLGAGASILI